MQSAFVRKSTEKCCKAAAAIVQRCIYFADDRHKYVLPSQLTVCKEHKSAASEKVTGLFSSQWEQPKHIHNHLQGNGFWTQQIFTSTEANHRLQKGALTHGQGSHAVTSALPPAQPAALTQHLCLWSSARQVLLTPSAGDLQSFGQVRMPPQNQHGQKRL